MGTDDFPLLILQLLPGSSPGAESVRVRGAESAGSVALERLFGEFGLAAALGRLTCLLPASAIDGLATSALPEGLTLQADVGVDPPPPPPPAPCKGPAQALLLRILAQVARDAETREIEATLKQDPQLSVELLRLVNSAAFAPAGRINSFAHAITLLGRRQLQRWLQLLMYASQARGGGANPLLARAALRAALMEGLCRELRQERAAQDEAFMTGMFSLLDQLFGEPLAQVIAPLHLVAEVSEALLRHSGRSGELLALVEAGEAAPEQVPGRLERAGIGSETWCRAQVAALDWTLKIGRET